MPVNPANPFHAVVFHQMIATENSHGHRIRLSFCRHAPSRLSSDVPQFRHLPPCHSDLPPPTPRRSEPLSLTYQIYLWCTNFRLLEGHGPRICQGIDISQRLVENHSCVCVPPMAGQITHISHVRLHSSQPVSDAVQRRHVSHVSPRRITSAPQIPL